MAWSTRTILKVGIASYRRSAKHQCAAMRRRRVSMVWMLRGFQRTRLNRR